MEKQRTIEKEFCLEGTGLHTAVKTNLVFKPAGADTGIVFVRTDLPHKPVIKACLDNLLPAEKSPRRTSIGAEGAEIHTIEHLLSALSGAGIDNVFIEINGSEIPGVDGSSIKFFELFQQSGIKQQDQLRDYYTVKEPIFIEEPGGAFLALLPSLRDTLRLSYTLSYDHPLLKSQFIELELTSQSFKSEIASARTFCLEDETGELKEMGVGCGANYQNTLVVGKDGVIKNSLRFPDEFVRHKILDLIGDLYVFGQPIKGRLIAVKSGHSLNLKLLKKLSQQRQRGLAAAIEIKYQPDENEQLDAAEVMKVLPHREPFLFVDRIIALKRGSRAVGIKNVTINDYFFRGHFPGRPVMPGVLIIEAMAQVGGVMMLSPEEYRGKLAFFMAVDKVKFRRVVVPGDQLVLEAEVIKIRSKIGQIRTKAYVDGKVAVEAELMFALVDK